jgi:hypothetical protein
MSGRFLENTAQDLPTLVRVFRTVAWVLGAALLAASSCKDNLVKGNTGPATFRASIGTNDLQANGASTSPRVGATSADGRFVVFESTATNLFVPSIAATEIFVRDRGLDVVENISQLAKFNAKFLGGLGANLEICTTPAISPDGRYVAFVTKNVLVGTESTPQTIQNIFFFDRHTATLSRVLPTTWPDHDMLVPSIGITATGTPLLAFQSQATNLGFSNAGATNQVYVADMSLATPAITLVSRDMTTPTTIANDNATIGQISADGTTVSFGSRATNLTADVLPPTTTMIFVGTIGLSVTVELVSRASGATGTLANGDSFIAALSADGRFVAFVTRATNLSPSPPIFSIVVRDRNPAAPTTTFAAGDPDGVPIIFGIVIFDTVSISGDGRFVVYHASTDNQIYAVDMQGGRSLVSRSTAGAVSNNLVAFTTPVISGDGRWVFWNSDADNLVTDDTNSVQDVFGQGPGRF